VPAAIVIVGKKRYENALQQSVDIFVLDDGFQHLQLHRDLDVVIDNPAAGFLREGRSALRFADIVLPRRMKPTIPDSLRGKRVFAFAGLADNQQFFESLGLQVVGSRAFRDHHRYRASDLEQIKQEARNAGAETIVTTEKDAVKIDDPAIIAIPAELVIDKADLDRIIAAARK
jgi:tetraacyldisaccharide 4'-kinase